MSLKIELTASQGEKMGTPKPNKHIHTCHPFQKRNKNPQTKKKNQKTPSSTGIQYLTEIIEILLTLLFCSLEKIRKNVRDTVKNWSELLLASQSCLVYKVIQVYSLPSVAGMTGNNNKCFTNEVLGYSKAQKKKII